MSQSRLTSAVLTALGASEYFHYGKGRISQIERAERERSLTLERPAALDCRVEYVLVPHRPLDDMVWDHARAKATAEIAAVDQTMALEDQPSAESARQLTDDAAQRYVDKRGLWLRATHCLKPAKATHQSTLTRPKDFDSVGCGPEPI